MRVLVGCETSGVVRRAFAALGHDVWSVDLLPAEDGSNRHIVGDVRDHLADGWDLLAVLHPPCTRLCNSGVRWLSVPPPGRSREDMWADLHDACELFAACLHAPIPRRAIENPIMHKHARERIPGLPPLVPTRRLDPPRPGTPEHKAWSAVHRAPPGPDRWKRRSRTFDGLAAAMADQWGQAA
jgi:hypothetical protein